MLYRYEIGIKGSSRAVGLITGGWALGVLSESDLRDMNEHLVVP